MEHLIEKNLCEASLLQTFQIIKAFRKCELLNLYLGYVFTRTLHIHNTDNNILNICCSFLYCFILACYDVVI